MPHGNLKSESKDGLSVSFVVARKDGETADDYVYVRVELFNPIGTLSKEKSEFTARQFIVSNEVSDFTGNGGEKISASGTLRAVGDPVFGKFDTVTKTFTEGEFKGKYDLALDDEEVTEPGEDTE